MRVVHALHNPVNPRWLTLVFLGQPGGDLKKRYYTVHPQQECQSIIEVHPLLTYVLTITGDRDSVWHVFEVHYDDAVKGETKHESKSGETTPKKTGAKVIEFKNPNSSK